MKKIISLFVFFLSYSVYSQGLFLYNTDITNFPLVKANIFAFDDSDNQITNISVNDFEVRENYQIRNITNIICPSYKPPEKLSSVLVMDISGSMSGINLEFAQAAANAWLDMFPFNTSECAIASFNNSNYLTQLG